MKWLDEFQAERREKRQLKRLAEIRMGIQDAYADTEMIHAIVELEGAPEYAVHNVEQTYAGAEEVRHAGRKFTRLAWKAYERTADNIDFKDEGEYL